METFPLLQKAHAPFQAKAYTAYTMFLLAPEKSEGIRAVLKVQVSINGKQIILHMIFSLLLDLK